MSKTPVITNKELRKALAELKQQGTVDPTLFQLLEMIVDRLQETAEVFNEHEHPVHSVEMVENNIYRSIGDGHTSKPAAENGFGCHLAYLIGVDRKEGR